MTITTVSNRGRPAHVLLSIKHYQELTKTQKSIVDLLAMPDASDIELDLNEF